MTVRALDPATPDGAAAEQQLNAVLAGVLVRLAQEDAAAAPAVPVRSTA